jgi:hypothetical protein
MGQVEQEFGKANPNAPAALSGVCHGLLGTSVRNFEISA